MAALSIGFSVAPVLSMKWQAILIISFLLGFSNLSPAAVDPVRGALRWQETDFELTPLLKLDRRYSSRSLHHGWFGFGWCSNLEPNCFPSKGGQKETLRYDYNSEHTPIAITSSLGPSLRLQWDKSGRHVVRIETSIGQIYRFKYDGANLISVVISDKALSYQYDKLNNLIAALLNSNPLLQAVYNLDQDQLLWSHAAGCEDQLTYSLEDQRKFWVARTTWLRRCGESPTTEREFKFSVSKQGELYETSQPNLPIDPGRAQ